MAKGGFVVNYDGQQQGCSKLSVDFDKHWITVQGKEGGQSGEVKDWSTFSAHATTKKEAEDIVSESNPRRSTRGGKGCFRKIKRR